MNESVIKKKRRKTCLGDGTADETVKERVDRVERGRKKGGFSWIHFRG